MEPILLPDINPDAFLGFSALPITALIASIIQAFVRSGLHIRHVSLLGLVLGLGFAILAYASFGGVLVVAIVQGIVMGFAGWAVWAHFSTRMNTNGD